MDDLLARTMVENLSIGIDPITGKLLRQDDSCANEFVQEAIRTVLDHCTIDSYATILERQRKEQKEQREKKNGRSGIRIRENLGQKAKRERSPSSAVKDTISLTLQTY